MPSSHILSLEVPEVSNCEILTIRDTSQYATNLAVDCPELLITVPGYNAAVLKEVTPGFEIDFNGCALGTQTTHCGTKRTTLLDGVYIFKYSVSPNTTTFVEYNHLRVCDLMTKYYNTLCELDVTACQPSGKKQDAVREMSFIRTLIDAAVAKVEYCHRPDEGMEIYNYAKRRLEKLSCTHNCSTGQSSSSGY